LAFAFNAMEKALNRASGERLASARASAAFRMGRASTAGAAGD
jgi:hypothetical protein